MSTLDSLADARPTMSSINSNVSANSSAGSSKPFLPQATLPDLISLLSPVDLSLSTILSNPTPLVGVVIQNSIPSCINVDSKALLPLSASPLEDIIAKQLRPVANKSIRLLPLSPTQVLPAGKPTRTTYDGYLPQGLLRYDWVHKHSYCVPELVLFCFEYIYGLPFEDQEQEWLRTYSTFTQLNPTRAARALVAVFLPEQVSRLHTRIILKDKDKERDKEKEREREKEKVDDSEEETFLSQSVPAASASSFPSFSTLATIEQQLALRVPGAFKRLGVDSKRVLVLPVQPVEDLTPHISTTSDTVGVGAGLHMGAAPPPVAVHTCLSACLRSLTLAAASRLEGLLSAQTADVYAGLAKRCKGKKAKAGPDSHPLMFVRHQLKAGWYSEASNAPSAAVGYYNAALATLQAVVTGSNTAASALAYASSTGISRDAAGAWVGPRVLEARALSLLLTTRASIAAIRAGQPDEVHALFAQHSAAFLALKAPAHLAFLDHAQQALAAAALAHILDGLPSQPLQTPLSRSAARVFHTAALACERRTRAAAMLLGSCGLVTLTDTNITNSNSTTPAVAAVDVAAADAGAEPTPSSMSADERVLAVPSVVEAAATQLDWPMYLGQPPTQPAAWEHASPTPMPLARISTPSGAATATLTAPEHVTGPAAHVSLPGDLPVAHADTTANEPLDFFSVLSGEGSGPADAHAPDCGQTGSTAAGAVVLPPQPTRPRRHTAPTSMPCDAYTRTTLLIEAVSQARYAPMQAAAALFTSAYERYKPYGAQRLVCEVMGGVARMHMLQGKTMMAARVWKRIAEGLHPEDRALPSALWHYLLCVLRLLGYGTAHARARSPAGAGGEDGIAAVAEDFFDLSSVPGALLTPRFPSTETVLAMVSRDAPTDPQQRATHISAALRAQAAHHHVAAWLALQLLCPRMCLPAGPRRVLWAVLMAVTAHVSELGRALSLANLPSTSADGDAATTGDATVAPTNGSATQSSAAPAIATPSSLLSQWRLPLALAGPSFLAAEAAFIAPPHTHARAAPEQPSAATVTTGDVVVLALRMTSSAPAPITLASVQVLLSEAAYAPLTLTHTDTDDTSVTVTTAGALTASLSFAPGQSRVYHLALPAHVPTTVPMSPASITVTLPPHTHSIALVAPQPSWPAVLPGFAVPTTATTSPSATPDMLSSVALTLSIPITPRADINFSTQHIPPTTASTSTTTSTPATTSAAPRPPAFPRNARSARPYAFAPAPLPSLAPTSTSISTSTAAPRPLHVTVLHVAPLAPQARISIAPGAGASAASLATRSSSSLPSTSTSLTLPQGAWVQLDLQVHSHPCAPLHEPRLALALGYSAPTLTAQDIACPAQAGTPGMLLSAATPLASSAAALAAVERLADMRAYVLVDGHYRRLRLSADDDTPDTDTDPYTDTAAPAAASASGSGPAAAASAQHWLSANIPGVQQPLRKHTPLTVPLAHPASTSMQPSFAGLPALGLLPSGALAALDLPDVPVDAPLTVRLLLRSPQLACTAHLTATLTYACPALAPHAPALMHAETHAHAMATAPATTAVLAAHLSSSQLRALPHQLRALPALSALQTLTHTEALTVRVVPPVDLSLTVAAPVSRPQVPLNTLMRLLPSAPSIAALLEPAPLGTAHSPKVGLLAYASPRKLSNVTVNAEPVRASPVPAPPRIDKGASAAAAAPPVWTGPGDYLTADSLHTLSVHLSALHVGVRLHAVRLVLARTVLSASSATNYTFGGGFDNASAGPAALTARGEWLRCFPRNDGLRDGTCGDVHSIAQQVCAIPQFSPAACAPTAPFLGYLELTYSLGDDVLAAPLLDPLTRVSSKTVAGQMLLSTVALPLPRLPLLDISPLSMTLVTPPTATLGTAFPLSLALRNNLPTPVVVAVASAAQEDPTSTSTSASTGGVATGKGGAMLHPTTPLNTSSPSSLSSKFSSFRQKEEARAGINVPPRLKEPEAIVFARFIDTMLSLPSNGGQQYVNVDLIPKVIGKHKIPMVHVGIPRSGATENYLLPVTHPDHFPALFVEQ